MRGLQRGQLGGRGGPGGEEAARAGGELRQRWPCGLLLKASAAARERAWGTARASGAKTPSKHH
eukprot:738402-Lingulodinium_polyedra.AAC.1